MKLKFAFIVHNFTLKARVHTGILFSYLFVGREKIFVISVVLSGFYKKKTVAARIELSVRCNREGREELGWIL
jgi:Na+-transporting NADH:ubiquinone oxidoreductase subunit NqrA